jgi:pimeloyl-ACP methyl ester carboxylesterase
VAVTDLGGDGPPLLLSHATGFCGGVLRPMAVALAASFHCWALDLRGHGATVTPPEVDFAWRGFADDVLAVVDALDLRSPFGFGHSSGGAALLDAEARRPGTFTALYCYEPILWPEPPPADSRKSLVEGALRRRETFPSIGEAYVHFAAKPPLSALTHDALRAYVKCGFEPVSDGDGDGASIRLRCRPATEAAIYGQGLVHDGFSRLDQVACPVMIASGDSSEALEPGTFERQAAAMPHAWTEVLEGLGHLGPLGDPPGVAGAVLEAFA